jgi:hypothetical protein
MIVLWYVLDTKLTTSFNGWSLMVASFMVNPERVDLSYSEPIYDAFTRKN